MSRVEVNTDNYNVFIADDVFIKWTTFFFFLFFWEDSQRNEIVTSGYGRLNGVMELLLIIFFFFFRIREEREIFVNFVFFRIDDFNSGKIYFSIFFFFFFDSD